MKIHFNNNEVNTNNSELYGFLEEQDLQDKPGIAIALNNEIIQKAN